MRRAPRVHPDLEIREPLDERPGRARVVEVDVGQEQRPRLLGEAVEKRLDAALGAGIDDRATEVPGADHTLAIALEDVDQLASGAAIAGRLTAPPLNSYRDLWEEARAWRALIRQATGQAGTEKPSSTS